MTAASHNPSRRATAAEAQLLLRTAASGGGLVARLGDAFTAQLYEANGCGDSSARAGGDDINGASS